MSENISEQIILPERLVSSADLSRLIRELEAIDESLNQSELRKPGEPTKLARSSATLEEMAKVNNVQLTDKTQRLQMLAMLQAFKDHAPRIHLSVASEPTANFNRMIIIWLRKNIHPLMLLEIGLQPTLAAGCMLRTDNKIFDMSLRHRFAENRGILIQKISEIGQKAEAVPQSAPAVPPAGAAE